MSKKLLLLPVILLSFAFTELYSQGLNSVIALDDINVIAAGNQGKILRSSNGGTTWAKYTIGTSDFKSAAAFGDNVWLAGNDGKVYKTNKSSSPVNGYATGTANSLNGISFVNASTGFACAEGGLIYKTVNGGLNWALSNTGIPIVKLNTINFRDANYGTTAGDNGKIFFTDNGGVSWTEVSSGTTRNLSKVKVFSSGAIIVGEWGTILSLSGITVTPVNSRTNSDIRGVSGIDNTEVHICGGGGFIRNNKSGSSEYLNFEQNPMLANLVDISFWNSSLGYAVSSLNDAIIRTTNGGANWQLSGGATMSVSYVQKLGGGSGIGNGIAYVPSKRDVLYVCYGRTISRSGDRGETWSTIATIPNTIISSSSTHSFYVSPLDTNIFMVASENAPTDRVVRSTDYGQTWSVILNMNFTSYGTPLEMDQNNPSIYYYAPDGGGFWKSTNNGANFVEISGNYPFRSPCDISISWQDPNTILLADGVTSASQPADLFKSTNGGVNWVKVHTNPGTGGGFSEIPCILNSVFDANLWYITNWSGSMRFKSTNGGSNWFSIQSTSFSGWTGEICREDPTVVLTGNYGQNVSLTTNSGANWTEYPLPSGSCGAGTMIIGRDYMISQQCGALLKMKVTYTLVTNVNEGVLSIQTPEKYNLYQNYPNPFNPTTEIRYDILKQGFASLKVYDINGKEIYTLSEGNKSPGSYSIKFDASSLSSGIYYYTLETNGSTFTKKMMLVK